MSSKQTKSSISATTAIGKPMPTNVHVSSLILPNVLVPYIWPTSPASFCTGVVVGLIIAFIRPMIEFYVDVGASYIAVCMRFILIWGSVAFIAWLVLRVLQQTSAATLVINPDKPNEQELEDENSLYKSQLSGSQPLPLPDPPTPQQQFQAQMRLQSRSLHSLKQPTVFDINPANQPPVLHLYERASPELNQIEYSYERVAPQANPAAQIAYQQQQFQPSSPPTAATHLYVPTTTISNGHIVSSAASVYSDITTSSGSSNQSSASGNYYSPPIPQYNPYNKALSPTPASRRGIPEDAHKMNVSPTRPSPVRKSVNVPQPIQHTGVAPIPASSNPAMAASGYARPIRSAGAVSPVRRQAVANNSPTKHNTVEPRIVPLDEDDHSTGHSYRPYPNRIQQIQAIYGGSNVPGAEQQHAGFKGKENYHPEGITVLEKPAGQSAFRLKRRP